MYSVVTVVGARPQFIKAAPLVTAFTKRFSHRLVHTGQHFDDAMSGAFFRELGIRKPHHHLGLSGGTHAEMTGSMMTSLEKLFVRQHPHMVVVLGDTNTTLAAALAAAKVDIPVAHVEAGLRSYDMKMPEEINRKVVDHVSTLLFCPTVAAARILAGEGITRGVSVVGDVMTDVLQKMRRTALAATRGLDLPRDFYYATIHRQENTDDRERLKGIIEAFGRLPYPVILPLHPRTAARLRSLRIRLPERVGAVPPASYKQSLGLALRARAVLTDSGGLQKEAFLLGRPCVTIRDTTEWVETLKGGANRLAGWKSEAIVRAVRAIERRPPTVEPGRIYGDGHASDRIARTIEKFLEKPEKE